VHLFFLDLYPSPVFIFILPKNLNLNSFEYAKLPSATWDVKIFWLLILSHLHVPSILNT
jgi:hypothetical protein